MIALKNKCKNKNIAVYSALLLIMMLILPATKGSAIELKNEELKKKLLKLAPDLKKQIEYVIYLGTKTANKQQLSDQEVINLFNYTNQIIQRT